MRALYAVILVGFCACASAAEDVVVEAKRSGDIVEVRARATLAATVPLAWQVLTDYDNLASFIPGLSRSKVRSRQGLRLLLDQSGEARYLFFSFPIEVSLEVTESPPDWIASRAAGGNLRRMDGRYDLQPDPAKGGVLLRYTGSIEPDFGLPPFIGLAALRRSVEEQFVAMVAEIERRASAAGTRK